MARTKAGTAEQPPVRAIVPPGKGWRELDIPGEFLRRNGPFLWRRNRSGFEMGFRVRTMHCDEDGRCHRIQLATLADIVTGFGVPVEHGLPQFLPTIALTCNWTGHAYPEDWVSGRCRTIAIDGDLAFANCLIRTGRRPLLAAEAIFKIPATTLGDVDLLDCFRLSPGRASETPGGRAR